MNEMLIKLYDPLIIDFVFHILYCQGDGSPVPN